MKRKYTDLRKYGEAMDSKVLKKYEESVHREKSKFQFAWLTAKTEDRKDFIKENSIETIHQYVDLDLKEIYAKIRFGKMYYYIGFEIKDGKISPESPDESKYDDLKFMKIDKYSYKLLTYIVQYILDKGSERYICIFLSMLLRPADNELHTCWFITEENMTNIYDWLDSSFSKTSIKTFLKTTMNDNYGITHGKLTTKKCVKIGILKIQPKNIIKEIKPEEQKNMSLDDMIANLKKIVNTL